MNNIIEYIGIQQENDTNNIEKQQIIIKANLIENIKKWILLDTNIRVRSPKKVYIEYYGSIPPNHIIYHIDGNNKNDSINNLKAITRKELLLINRKKII